MHQLEINCVSELYEGEKNTEDNKFLQLKKTKTMSLETMRHSVEARAAAESVDSSLQETSFTYNHLITALFITAVLMQIHFHQCFHHKTFIYFFVIYIYLDQNKTLLQVNLQMFLGEAVHLYDTRLHSKADFCPHVKGHSW